MPLHFAIWSFCYDFKAIGIITFQTRLLKIKDKSFKNWKLWKLRKRTFRSSGGVLWKLHIESFERCRGSFENWRKRSFKTAEGWLCILRTLNVAGEALKTAGELWRRCLRVERGELWKFLGEDFESCRKRALKVARVELWKLQEKCYESCFKSSGKRVLENAGGKF